MGTMTSVLDSIMSAALVLGHTKMMLEQEACGSNVNVRDEECVEDCELDSSGHLKIHVCPLC